MQAVTIAAGRQPGQPRRCSVCATSGRAWAQYAQQQAAAAQYMQQYAQPDLMRNMRRPSTVHRVIRNNSIGAGAGAALDCAPRAGSAGNWLCAACGNDNFPSAQFASVATASVPDGGGAGLYATVSVGIKAINILLVVAGSVVLTGRANEQRAHFEAPQFS